MYSTVHTRMYVHTYFTQVVAKTVAEMENEMVPYNNYRPQDYQTKTN